MSRYVVTSHAGLAGVGLSKPGHWGGRRFPDDASAVATAREDAKGAPIAIEREHVRRRLPPLSEN